MANVLRCTSMKIVRGNAGWDWHAYSDGERRIYGPLPHTGKRPRLASLVSAIPRRIKCHSGECWEIPRTADDPKAWRKIRGVSCYLWEAKLHRQESQLPEWCRGKTHDERMAAIDEHFAKERRRIADAYIAGTDARIAARKEVQK